LAAVPSAALARLRPHALALNVRATLRYARAQARRRRLASRHLRGTGLEIGALHRPLRVPSEATVRYVDRMDVAGLRSHYPELADEELVAVDIIDDGERLGSQPEASADFIIANHFIEHTEDPLGTLANHLRVLRPGGVLYLAVPDRRRTFDAARQATPLEHVIADRRHGPDRSRAAHQEEWARLVEKVPAAEVPARARTLEREGYSIHFHVWTPGEFRALLEYARDGEGLPFAIEALEANGDEFIAILRRT
jgi:SAM-dependent methyltransferase